MKNLKVAVLGFGNAGQAFAKLLINKKIEILQGMNYGIDVVAITTRSRGSLVSENGVDLENACKDIEASGKFDKNDKSYSNITSMEVVEKVDYDVLIELTPLVIFSGQPAIDHIKKALKRGKHVITANKGPIAWAFEELKELAKKQDSLFYYETTVMDGTPIFNLVNDTLKFCKVLEINGILNSTTNFVLEELAKGRLFDEVISEGKKRGFIEADPAMDLEGWDAAAKTAALLNVLMSANITPNDIDRTGIVGISYEDIKEADERGNVIKLLCHGSIKDGKVAGIVKPTEVKKNNLLASITGTSSVVSITTDLMGTISIVEHDPEIEQTAYGIFSDLLRILSKL
ncbi:MAG TPA: hypothetical protein VFC27_04330 [Anaerovoracaceae bacterium]|nr:hypothetical protein [Anaerovoracaceae bacterium]